jgi:hypothetical protein
VIRANIAHRRLLAQNGPRLVHNGTRVVTGIIWDWTRWSFQYRYSIRLRVLGLEDGNRLTLDDPRCEAACYPDVVALATVLSSPHWRQIALSSDPENDLPALFGA